MNPAANAATSGGLAGAAVTIINSWFVALHFAPMTPDVATAYGIVLTALFGFVIHLRTSAPLVAGLSAIPTQEKPPVAAQPQEQANHA